MAHQEEQLQQLNALVSIAENYDRLGRFALSSTYYGNALSLACQIQKEGDVVDGIQDIFYRALKARNFYVDDPCQDLQDLARICLTEEQVMQTYRSVMSHPRSLHHDPVEMTDAYLAIIDEVEALVEKNLTLNGIGACHEVWQLKKQFLLERGIVWHTPKELNPRVRFD